jgi:hypothetical protein
MGQRTPLKRSFDNDDSFDFVCCRICGDHRRVISGRNLSKHDTDRETYMEEYHLTPDELIAKDFRRIQSSRRGFYPHGKRTGLLRSRSFMKPFLWCATALWNLEQGASCCGHNADFQGDVLEPSHDPKRTP